MRRATRSTLRTHLELEALESRCVPSAAYQREVTLDAAPAAVVWDGDRAVGANTNNRYTGAEPPHDPTDPSTFVDSTLLRVNVAPSYWGNQGGGLYVSVADPPLATPSDFDLVVYSSDATGSKGGLVAQSHGAAGTTEVAFVGRASGYYLVQVYYYAVADSYYSAEAQLVTRDLLPDAGQPPGVESSLPWDVGGARPGPDVLYADAPEAPILQNRDPRFRAAPLMVSGTEAYAAGEYLYQDYLYDDHGADTDGDGAGGDSPRVGDLNYPADPARYANNAADLVEFRVAAGQDEVAYRVTLNTLLQPDSTVIAIAFDTDRDAATGSATLPLDPGAPFPGTDEVVLVWGTGAAHYRWTSSGWAKTTLPSPSADLEANQIALAVPRAISNPHGVWRATVATGLYDPSTAAAGGGWLRPVADKSGIFNLGFRFNEPVFAEQVPPDTMQAVALRDNAPTRFAHDIDFGQLDAGVSFSTVPTTGPQVRLFPSRLELGEGRLGFDEYPSLRGQLQPYFVYVPTTYRPGRPAGLVLLPIYAGNFYWAYNREPELVRRLGEESGNIVLVPQGRGRNHMFRNEAEYDTFEAWNDAAARFSLDPDRAAIAGISMGGYGAYRLGLLYPDLFARAVTMLGPPGEGAWVPPAPPTGFEQGRPIGSLGASSRLPGGAPETLTNLYLENARNVPFLNFAGVLDELVPFAGAWAQNMGMPDVGIKGFNDHGYQFLFRVLDAGDHTVSVGLRESYGLVQEWLGEIGIDRNPPHVTFAYVPAADEPTIAPDDPRYLGLKHDHAYWVSGLVLADPNRPTAYGGSVYPARGVIDAFSHAFGVARRDPPLNPAEGLEVRKGMAGTAPVTDFSRSWGEPQQIPKENRLDVTMTNLAAATIDVHRAGLDLRQTLTVLATSDGPAELTLVGPFPNVAVTGAVSRRVPGGLVLVLTGGSVEVTITPAPDRPTDDPALAEPSQPISTVSGTAPATTEAASIAALFLALPPAGPDPYIPAPTPMVDEPDLPSVMLLPPPLETEELDAGPGAVILTIPAPAEDPLGLDSPLA